MRHHSTTSISPRTGSSVPFGKPSRASRPRLAGSVVSLAFGAFGASLIVVAFVTALVSDLPAEVSPLLEGLERAGLDKGPLAMFGLLTIGVALGMRRAQPQERSTKDLVEHRERELQGLENHFRESSAAVEALRKEVHSIHHFMDTGFEAIQTASHNSQEAGNDRIFRLAASLDQLGALVDRKLDTTRDELKEMIATSEQGHRAAIDAQLSIAAGQESTHDAPSGDDTPKPVYPGNSTEAMASFMADLRSLPQDLLEGSEELASAPEGQGEIAPPVDPGPAAALPHEDPVSSDHGLNEGLKLIDQMEREPSSTPPLFPEMGPGEGS